MIEILETEDFNQESLRSISPFHTATKFLDSSKAYYTVIWELLIHLNYKLSIGINNTDNIGLTILDIFFMTILRSHSLVSPSVLRSTFTESCLTFEGADIDICGRWDADSPCI